jgi:diadenosine tetraphosphatase ApaH/serine/threonine PP2A family protein phosphatase
MRLLVLSDIHANLTALEAVLADAAGRWDRVWFLGDLVGYGPDPNEVIGRLRALDALALSGNHDWAVLGKLDLFDFNEDARRSVEWTRRQLTAENRDYLQTLPPQRVEGIFSMAHASPRHPVWEYILDLETAFENFAFFDTAVCLIGHSHMPLLFHINDDGEDLVGYVTSHGEKVELGLGRTILNPGSIGQPRDGDPRAAYALLDTDAGTWEYRRVAYDIEAVQQRMRDAGLPQRSILRLEQGL